jgi:hypothetical protein
VQLYRYFVSQSSEFYRHNPLCCFSTCVYFLRVYFVIDSVRKLLDTPSSIKADVPHHTSCSSHRNVTWLDTQLFIGIGLTLHTTMKHGIFISTFQSLQHFYIQCGNLRCPLGRQYLPEYTRVYPKVSGLSHNEIYAYNNKHSLRSNTKGCGGKTH